MGHLLTEYSTKHIISLHFAQFYYFNKNKTNYYVIGSLTEEIFVKLIEFIKQLNEIEHVVDNL